MMYEAIKHEVDEDWERALYAAFVREPAPEKLFLSVERHLFDARQTPGLPIFRLVSASTRSAWPSLWSVAAHAAVFAVIALVLQHTKGDSLLKRRIVVTQIDVRRFVPKAGLAGGGGGGGAHDVLPASKGKLPRFDQRPIVPPMLLVNEHPKLEQQPAIVMPKDMQFASELPNLGDPRTSVTGPPANGTGDKGGMGTGSGGGVGSGRGDGYGPGLGGGYGTGLYQVGGDVTAPQLIFAVDPEFSDEARRAKFQGDCWVSLIVDVRGVPQQIRVVRHLGMGLDERAVAAVKQYRFKPATLKGTAVPVEINVEVIFRIY
jgi:periplasmic protein TonB